MEDIYNDIKLTDEMFENLQYDDKTSEEGGYSNYSLYLLIDI